jgi:RHS repeat-associated protein
LLNNPIGPVEVDSTYDSGGRLQSQSHPYSGSGDPNRVFEAFSYDAVGRQISTTHPDGEAQLVAYGPNVGNLLGATIQQSSGAVYGYGYPQVSEDESGHLRQQWLDGFGRIIEADDPNSSGVLSYSPVATSYLYDAADRLTQVIQGTQTRTFAYDGLGRKTYENTPEGGIVTYSYTMSSGGLCSGNPSNICYRTDARNVVSTYTYDNAGRLTGVAYSVPSGQNISSMPNVCTTVNGTAANVCYFYDQGGAAAYAIGLLTKMVDPTGSESYSYDANGRVTQLSKVINNQTYNIGYRYDVGGDVTQIIYPSGRVVQQAYNAIGQLCEIAPMASGCSDTTYYASGFSYNAPGKLTGFNYGNGVSAKSYYSPDRMQLVYLAYAKGKSNYFSLQYSYRQNSQYAPPCSKGTMGNNGTVQCIMDNVDSGRTVNYSYDPLQRMTSAQSCGSSAFPQWGLAESYDRFGNRLVQSVTAGSGPSTNMSFNSNNQPIGYAYDPSGNMTVEPLLPSNTMTYDGESRMTAFQGFGGAASYTYDGNGLRVVKSVQGGTATVNIFSGSSVIAEYDNGAAPDLPSREYIYNPAGGATTGLLAKISKGATTYYHQDHLSVRLTTDADGNILTQQGSFPFGESWYSNLGPGDNWFFTSYDRDSESGLDYALARYYDPRTGTFCSADPLAGSPDDPQSWNRYPYGRNDPIDITDPSGKNWFFTLLQDIGIALAPFTGGATLGFAEGVSIMNAFDNLTNGQPPWGFNPFSGIQGSSATGTWTDSVPVPSGGLTNGIQQALGMPTLADVGGPIIDNLSQTPNSPKCSTAIMQPQYTKIFGKMGKQLQINPLFIMSTSLQESGWNLAHVYGTNSSSKGKPLNNLFGMTNAGGNNIPYPSVQASADAWTNDWGPYLAGQPQTIQAYASSLNSNPKHMYNSNKAYPAALAARYAQLVSATTACKTTF